MTTFFDDKGKVFTDIISKRSIHATIQTTIQRIEGKIHVKEDERPKDMLNASEQFLAVTAADVFNNDGEVIYRCSFLAINRDHIVWISPEDDQKTSQSSSENIP